MQTKLLRWPAIAYLTVMGLLTAGALIHIPMWTLGMYDPVAHDDLPPERLPWYVALIFTTPLVMLATFRTALKYANPTKPSEVE